MLKTLYHIAGLSLCLLIAIVTSAHPLTVPQDEVKVIIEGTHVLAAPRLGEMTQKCLAEYEYTRRDRDPRILDECVRLLRHHMASQGYLQAKTGEPKVNREEGLSVTVPIEEGERYLLGDVSIEGVTLFTPAYVREMLKLQSGEVADGEALGEWIWQKVKREYEKLGYIQFAPELTPEFISASEKGADGVVNIHLTIDEGVQFRIGRIEFKGNEKMRDDVLRRALFIREGEVFNQESYEGSLKRLNEYGWFERILEKDVEFVSDEEAGVLNLRIEVKEKE